MDAVFQGRFPALLLCFLLINVSVLLLGVEGRKRDEGRSVFPEKRVSCYVRANDDVLSK